jgi:hypothetical protein
MNYVTPNQFAFFYLFHCAAQITRGIRANDPRRLQGRHCRARMQRGIAKRIKAGKAVYA